MTAADPVRLVYVTAGTEDEARTLGRTIVKERLAACANILGAATSIYEWEGEIEESAEWVVLFKTKDSDVDAMTNRIVEMHGYDCPCIIALPIVGGHVPFMEWVAFQTGDEAQLSPVSDRSQTSNKQ